MDEEKKARVFILVLCISYNLNYSPFFLADASVCEKSARTNCVVGADATGSKGATTTEAAALVAAAGAATTPPADELNA